MSTYKIIYLSAACAFYAITLILFTIWLILKVRKRSEVSVTLKNTQKGGLAGLLDFTKRHILTYSIVFCLTMAIASTFLMIQA